jgi:hypothetical protein
MTDEPGALGSNWAKPLLTSASWIQALGRQGYRTSEPLKLLHHHRSMVPTLPCNNTITLAAVTMTTNLAAENTNIFSHSSGGQKSKRSLKQLIPSEIPKENPRFASSTARGCPRSLVPGCVILICFCGYSSFSSPVVQSPSYKDTCDDTVSTWIILHNFSISRSSTNHSCKVPLL